MGVQLIIGEVRKVLADLEPNSVDFLFGSPPFLNLRSYLPADHPWKAFEIGAESTPGEYIDHLLDVVEGGSRVLTKHGSFGFELGDTRSGSGGAGGDYNPDGLREGQNKFKGSAYSSRYNDGGTHPRTGPGRTRADREGWPIEKSLCLVPEVFRFAMAYGFNPLTGREVERWRIRNVVRWIKRNPPVGAIGDRFRDGTSDIVFATMAADRWFDLDAVRHENVRKDEFSRTRAQMNKGAPDYHAGDSTENATQNPLGAPPLDWWDITPSSYKGAHYATFPEELCVVPIESMCPRRVCLECGKPSRRISWADPSPFTGLDGVDERRDGSAKGPQSVGPTGQAHGDKSRAAMTLGWTACECRRPGLWDDGWDTVHKELIKARNRAVRRKTPKAEREHLFTVVIPPLKDKLEAMYHGRRDGLHPLDGWRCGVVLDPFGGSGTTGVVAASMGRDCILIELDSDNVRLVDERVGLFLTDVSHA